MKYQEARNKLFRMFLFLAIGMFFIINIGHWVTYKPLKDRIDRFAERSISDEQVQFLTYIDHNARQQEVLMLKLIGPDEGVPMILENETQIDELTRIVDGQACKVRKAANSYEVNFICRQNFTVTLKDLTNKAWFGGSKYAFIGSLIILIIGFITSVKMSDEKIEDNFL